MPTEAMHRLNVSILNGAVTHWRGSPASEGGQLQGIDVSPVGGPPHFEYGQNDREQIKFNLETLILGADAAEQKAFIDSYARGTTFSAAQISGVPENLNWIIENANVRHNADGNQPSILQITLAETGPSS